MRFSHRIEYAGALVGTKLARLMSPRMADAFGAGLGSLVHTLWPKRRQVAYDNLRHSLGAELVNGDVERITHEVFRNIGRTFVEFSRFGRITPDLVRQIVIGDGLQYVDEALARGRGVVMASAHFGNWELLGCWFAAQGYPVDFVIGEQNNTLIDRLVIGFRREMGVGIISSRHSLKAVFKSLRANRLIGLVADQHACAGMTIDFFGRPCSAARGPAMFAVRTGSPLLPVLLRREKFDRHVVMAGEPLYADPSADCEGEVRRLTEGCARFFEAGIRQYPEQWMWTHRRWKLYTSGS